MGPGVSSATLNDGSPAACWPLSEVPEHAPNVNANVIAKAVEKRRQRCIEAQVSYFKDNELDQMWISLWIVDYPHQLHDPLEVVGTVEIDYYRTPVRGAKAYRDVGLKMLTK